MWVVESSVLPSRSRYVTGTAPSAEMVRSHTSCNRSGRWSFEKPRAGRAGFLYVADSKLATRDNMDHIASQGGRFLTILPRTRSEDKTGRAWLAKGPVPWTEISRRPGKRTADPDEIYWAVPAPSCSQEGYRIVWMRSS